jgi:hypothetical protein
MMSAAKPTKKMKPSQRPSLAASPQPIELPDGRRERISKKAFKLWQDRGYRNGHDLEDWFNAEAMVMEEIHEARE